MIFVETMLRQALPKEFQASIRPRQINFVRAALKNAPFHVRWAIVVLTMMYLPFVYIGANRWIKKYFHYFQLLDRVYRSLAFLIIYEDKK